MNLNFELILFYAVAITGLLYLLDVIFLKHKRKKHAKLPLLIDYAHSFFPVLLIVFLLRSFLFEPFRIPTGSLIPSLLIGDFILLNKFDYGIRLPVIQKKILNINEPKRGDIMVLHWPPNPSYYFIKRVIGLPGDKVSYINKELTINGQKIPQTFVRNTEQDEGEGTLSSVVEKQENLFGVKHDIDIYPGKASRDYIDVVVPEGMYFVMGDNRDVSADSRYWGFVPEENIVGKAVLVWMSWDSAKNAIRWNRLGKIIS